MPRIAVIGSVNLDIVAKAAKLPQPGETVTGAELHRFPGGKGANQALAAQRLGADVSLIGSYVSDLAARHVYLNFKLLGLKTIAPVGFPFVRLEGIAQACIFVVDKNTYSGELLSFTVTSVSSMTSEQEWRLLVCASGV